MGEAPAVVGVFPPAEHSPSEATAATLREALEHSPVIAWVKDLEGRYLYVNHRYRNDFGTSEDRLRGRLDAELPPRETVDGPRLRFVTDGLREPLDLEYTVPAFEGRPPLVAVRFALRDAGGQPLGTCGVAAPVAEAQLARDEAIRVMQLERREPVGEPAPTEQAAGPWQVTHQRPETPVHEAPPAYEPTRAQDDEQPPDELAPAHDAAPAQEAAPRSDVDLAQTWAEHAHQLQLDFQQALTRARESEAELDEVRGQRDQARAEAEAARAEVNTRVDQARAEAEAARAEVESLLDEVLAAERERSEELSRALARARDRLGDLEGFR